MLEVVRWDPIRGEAVVASGRGERASWWRNLQAAPAREIYWSGERFVPEQRVLGLAERVDVLRGYRRAHPIAARLPGPFVGLRDNERAIADLAGRLPMIAFRRR